MNTQVDQQPAFLIHTRNYSDSRILLELLTRDYGRVSAVRRFSRKSLKQFGVQAFTPLVVSWMGKTSLKTLTMVESNGRAFPLESDCLYCGFYLNELIQRCLPQEDPCDAVYELYQDTLRVLSTANRDRKMLEKHLRIFELGLLEALGFGIDFYHDVSGAEIRSGCDYRYVEGEGFYALGQKNMAGLNVFSAEVLVTIREQVYEGDSLLYAKRLCRQALAPLLGSRPLKSRELFGK